LTKLESIKERLKYAEQPGTRGRLSVGVCQRALRRPQEWGWMWSLASLLCPLCAA